jgi:dihydrolipoamide dehydrogenase
LLSVQAGDRIFGGGKAARKKPAAKAAKSSGKAAAIGNQTGFVKVIFDAKYGEWLGCHIIGPDATEMIAEASLARSHEAIVESVHRTVHAHPTLSEMMGEAALATEGHAIHV